MSSDFYDMNKIVKNLLDDEEFDQQHTPDVYVNQYCYRSTAGCMYNAMFFFNSGSMTVDIGAIQQLHCVIMACKMVGSQVMRFICDAVGSMQRLFRYLRKKEELSEISWLPICFVRFRNPYDPTRWIYMFHCVTHNLKNGRGKLWESLPDGKNCSSIPMMYSLAKLYLFTLGFAVRLDRTGMLSVRWISTRQQSILTNGVK